MCKKPFSFTTKVEFYDSDGRPYAIPVSATADNSIMTSFPYFLRTPKNEYEFYQNDEGVLMLKENVNSSFLPPTSLPYLNSSFFLLHSPLTPSSIILPPFSLLSPPFFLLPPPISFLLPSSLTLIPPSPSSHLSAPLTFF